MAAGRAPRAGTRVRRAALLLLLAGMIGLYAWIKAQRSEVPTATGAAAAGNDSSGYTARNVELVETGDDGLPRFRLQAAALKQVSAQDPLALQLPHISFSGTAGGRDDRLDLQLTASSGTLSPHYEDVEFIGDVRGQASSARTPLLRLTSSQLLVETVAQVVSSNRVVDLDWSGIHLTASGIRIELRTGVVKIGPGHGFQKP
jgi:LPS export ABC transporter protein LptC